MTVVTTNPAGDEDSGSDSGSGGGDYTSAPVYYGGASKQIAVDTDSLNQGAQSFASAADRFLRYAGGFIGFASYAPLQKGESDESWDKFSPDYYKRSQIFLDCLYGMAKAFRMLGESVSQFAKFCEDTEANNVEYGKNALYLSGESDPAGVPGGAERLETGQRISRLASVQSSEPRLEAGRRIARLAPVQSLEPRKVAEEPAKAHTRSVRQGKVPLKPLVLSERVLESDEVGQGKAHSRLVPQEKVPMEPQFIQLKRMRSTVHPQRVEEGAELDPVVPDERASSEGERRMERLAEEEPQDRLAVGERLPRFAGSGEPGGVEHERLRRPQER